MDKYNVAIIGSGPGGLSAACRAAESGLSHVLLEATPHISNTVYRYQKNKFVMAEPAVLPLRSPLPFAAGSREDVLSAWAHRADELQINLRHKSEVMQITGSRGEFLLTMQDGTRLQADDVVLAIGLQGNIRKLGVPGEDLPPVQYHLDDPDEYSGETIVVVGAGDAAIENAMALIKQNRVIIVNRKGEFSRAKEANNQAILAAIQSKTIPLECYYNSGVVKVEVPADAAAGRRARLVLNTGEGEAEIHCDRIIGRLGASPPRAFVEACGVQFPNNDPAAVPAVSARYESNVPGLYIIGALAGYPLIKQSINQGYEVIEFIAGNAVEAADTPLLREKFAPISGGRDVDAVLDEIQGTVPLLAPLTRLQMREFLLDSTIHVPQPGTVVFTQNDYTNSIYFILRGRAAVQLRADDPTASIRLRPGQFFGEMGLISGRRRSASVVAGTDCVLLETPRRSMLRLMSSVESVQRYIDEVFLLRAIQAHIAPGCSAEELAELVHSAKECHYRAGEILFHEGEAGDCLHLIRSGAVTVSRQLIDREVVLAYAPAGQYVGEMALISDLPRSATVKAAVKTETIRLDGADFKALMDRHADVAARVRDVYAERLTHDIAMSANPEAGSIISFLMQQGMGEATDILLIDESLCVRCDHCERACAATHGNVSRLDRDAGPSFANVHVPTSCRHCEHPHCMKDCPPDAIHRAANGEVYIDDSCIGCGNCEKNCPYDVIHMGVPDKRALGVVSWLLTGFGLEPGAETHLQPDLNHKKLAVKCDMCKDLSGGPACVRACPTGAALRVSPEKFMQLVSND
ncbi:MAG: cyclic nucleotide-binding domain-containing protein [Gammaproteobacteria bacterium]